jgi:DNA/RNA-binding domain of Phe-tRNA-synthetase-like protein
MYFKDKLNFTDIIRDKITGMQLGLLEVTDFTIKKETAHIESALQNLYDFVKEKFAQNPPSSDQVISAVRRMYRRIGWEPTRYRPSSEAMIRRILKNQNLYRINNAVDLGNITSARFHLPMGLYDSDKIDSSITFDVGKENETYQGLSIDLIHARGKLILRDKTGIFGNPTADSRRTCIDTNTRNILAIFFTPPEIEPEYLHDTLSYLKQLYTGENPALKSEMYTIIA